MLRRFLNIATVISTVLLATTLLLITIGFAINPWRHFLSIHDSLHVSLRNRGLDSRMVFFNDSSYGPYRGSVISLVGPDGKLHPPLERREAFGDCWGIYYRYFQWSHATLWTLTVSLWYPVIAYAILPVVCLLRRLSSCIRK